MWAYIYDAHCTSLVIKMRAGDPRLYSEVLLVAGLYLTPMRGMEIMSGTMSVIRTIIHDDYAIHMSCCNRGIIII